MPQIEYVPTVSCWVVDWERNFVFVQEKKFYHDVYVKLSVDMVEWVNRPHRKKGFALVYDGLLMVISWFVMVFTLLMYYYYGLCIIPITDNMSFTLLSFDGELPDMLLH